MLVFIIDASHEDEARLASLRRKIKLTLCGRGRISTFNSVFGAKNADVDVAALDLVKIHLFGTLIGGGKILEEDRLDKPPQERICTQEVPERSALGREFLLYAADKEAKHHDGLIPAARQKCVAASGRGATLVLYRRLYPRFYPR